MQKGRTPFSQFGNRLKELRLKTKESVLEVSGAVELDSEIVLRFEQGIDRPSEDILLLLINHFGIQDEEADELWDLAGYNQPHAQNVPDMTQLPTLVVVPNDSRIIYTDTANVTINNFGVVMNFMQNGINNQATSVARVGMSIEHAKSVLEVLGKTIKQAEAAKIPKQIPQSVRTTRNKKRRLT
ncbi:MAG: helix-turn-helix domain-containing protein [bacterium]|nr:helix-turn-helix domain-containing protein [bacterium]